jgi:uncharacterized DUF497 family protein
MATTQFEWDARKDLDNRNKHGVAFAQAQYAFADPRRIIADDTTPKGKAIYGRMSRRPTDKRRRVP